MSLRPNQNVLELEHLRRLQEQIASSGLSVRLKLVADIIIRNIDEFGYLERNVNELSSSSGYSAEEVNEALQAVQTFDPPGVAARNLRECMMLQLDRSGRRGSLEYRIVSEFMEALGRRDFAMIAQALGVTTTRVIAAVEYLTELHPRPLKP